MLTIPKSIKKNVEIRNIGHFRFESFFFQFNDTKSYTNIHSVLRTVAALVLQVSETARDVLKIYDKDMFQSFFFFLLKNPIKNRCQQKSEKA